MTETVCLAPGRAEACRSALEHALNVLTKCDLLNDRVARDESADILGRLIRNPLPIEAELLRRFWQLMEPLAETSAGKNRCGRNAEHPYLPVKKS